MDQGHEIWNRNSMFGPSVANPSAGGLLGGMILRRLWARDAAIASSFRKYPYAIGPRLGAAYQFDPKTVIRGGWGVVYANLATYQYFTNSAILGVGIDQLSFTSPAFGEPGVVLKNGLIYNPPDLYR